MTAAAQMQQDPPPPTHMELLPAQAQPPPTPMELLAAPPAAPPTQLDEAHNVDDDEQWDVDCGELYEEIEPAGECSGDDVAPPPEQPVAPSPVAAPPQVQNVVQISEFTLVELLATAPDVNEAKKQLHGLQQCHLQAPEEPDSEVFDRLETNCNWKSREWWRTELRSGRLGLKPMLPSSSSTGSALADL